jgi:hypothetical protein
MYAGRKYIVNNPLHQRLDFLGLVKPKLKSLSDTSFDGSGSMLS